VRATRWTDAAARLVVAALLAGGVLLPGCSPVKEKPVGGDAAAGPGAEPAQKPSLEAPKEPAAAPDKVPPVKPTAESPAEPGGAVALETWLDLPAASEVSAYAPAKDLVGEIDYYVRRLENAVKTQEDYDDSKDGIAKDANTLIVIALALGLHDQDNQFKQRAGGLLKAAQQAAAADGLEATKAAVQAVKQAAAGGHSTQVDLKWERVASLPELMKQVPLVHNRLKRHVKRNRVQQATGQAAVIAAIAQASMANAGDTEKPSEVDQWVKHCLAMRNAAAAVGAAVRAGDKAATRTAMEGLNKSCDDCHAVFHEEQLLKDQQSAEPDEP
jgi:hypothetical protein